MADIFSLLNTVGGQATTSASSGATLPALAPSTSAYTGFVLRVVTDSYVHIVFGTASSVSATNAAPLFAPGETYVSIPLNSTYYSIVSTAGTANYSISSGNVINQQAIGY